MRRPRPSALRLAAIRTIGRPRPRRRRCVAWRAVAALPDRARRRGGCSIDRRAAVRPARRPAASRVAGTPPPAAERCRQPVPSAGRRRHARSARRPPSDGRRYRRSRTYVADAGAGCSRRVGDRRDSRTAEAARGPTAEAALADWRTELRKRGERPTIRRLQTLLDATRTEVAARSARTSSRSTRPNSTGSSSALDHGSARG